MTLNKNGAPKPSMNECRQSVLNFFEEQTKFKAAQSQFNGEKEKFNSLMEAFFKNEALDKSVVFTELGVDEERKSYTVTRIQKSSVEFDADKLEKQLPKAIVKDVIIKRYEIVDIDGLIAYLKECGVDPKIFKSFLHVSKSVDCTELDRLDELGKISRGQVKGCYTVKRQKPYFTVSVKRGHDDGETKW
ncbi:MAG: hypothetical protein IKK92_01965 [Prevotella sp.]|nr:hypothetical protein [Prevotella sp.]